MCLSIFCVTVSFILEAKKGSWSSNLSVVGVSLFFIGAISDFPKDKFQCFELVFTTLMYAAAPHALLEVSEYIYNSTFCVLVVYLPLHWLVKLIPKAWMSN